MSGRYVETVETPDPEIPAELIAEWRWARTLIRVAARELDGAPAGLRREVEAVAAEMERYEAPYGPESAREAIGRLVGAGRELGIFHVGTGGSGTSASHTTQLSPSWVPTVTTARS